MDFRDYLNKLEDISVDHEPQVGDFVEIEMGDTLVETYITDVTEDGVIIQVDETALQLMIDAKKQLNEGVAEGTIGGDPDAFGEDDYMDIIQDMIDNNRRNMSPSRKPRVMAAVKRIVDSEGGVFNPKLFDEMYNQIVSFSRGVAEGEMDEAKYQGREVSLGKPFLTPDGPKKRSVYVKKPNGNVVKVNFGDKKMRIKKSSPSHRKSFRARHRCENPGPRWKARYWSCKMW